jgi:hypothetical protein
MTAVYSYKSITGRMGRRMLGVCFVDVEEEYSREKKWQIQKP